MVKLRISIIPTPQMAKYSLDV